MTTTVQAREYETIHDPAELRVVLRELHRVRSWIGQFTDIAAEMPGVELEHVRAAKATTTAVVSLLIERAEARLRLLAARPTPSEVLVLDPERGRLVNGAAGGLSFLPMVTEPMVATGGLSSAVVRLDPGRATVPLVYPDDVIMVVIFGGVDLIWWDDDGVIHHVAPRRHQHAYVRRGTRHRLVNSGAVQVVAVQARAGADVTAGAQLLPDSTDEG